MTTRTVAIMQPTYLPWLGYFDLMDQVDEFVLLDSVQLSVQSWQQRNRIRTASGLTWLSVPLRTKGRSGQLICETELGDSPDFPSTHLALIDHNYRKAPHLQPLRDELATVLESAAGHRHVSVLLIELIRLLASRLGITTPLRVSSEMAIAGDRSRRLIEICRAVGAQRYLSPPGAAGYLADDASAFASAGIPIFLHVYEHPEYRQQHEPFVPHASVIDLLLNHGPESIDIIRSGRRTARPLDKELT